MEDGGVGDFYSSPKNPAEVAESGGSG